MGNETWITLVFIIGLIASMGLSIWMGKRRAMPDKPLWKPSGLESSIVGFYTLIVSFTLFSSNNYMRDRVLMAHKHCDAIARVYRISNLKSKEIQLTISAALTEVLRLHVQAQNSGDIDLIRQNYHQIAVVYANLNKKLERISWQSQELNRQVNEIMPTLSDAIGLDYQVQYAAVETNHPLLIVLLLVGGWIVAYPIGFSNGYFSGGHYMLPAIFIILTVIIVATILDLNDPVSGFSRFYSQNYVDFYKVVQTSN